MALHLLDSAAATVRGVAGAIRGEAELLEASRPEPRTREDRAAGDVDVSDFGIGRHTFRLQVRLPGHDPYEVDGRFKVPPEVQFGKKRSMVLRPFVKRYAIPAGLMLPVDVDPATPEDVAIDWDAFLAAGGNDEMKRLNSAAAVAANDHVYAEQVQQMHDSAKPTIEAWAASVRAGGMTRKQFDESVARYVQLGYIGTADAEEISRSVD
jgi:hypothetical protein